MPGMSLEMANADLSADLRLKLSWLAHVIKWQCSRQNSKGCWQNHKPAEPLLPDTYEPAEPLTLRAKLSLRAGLDSLGQGASHGTREGCKSTEKSVGRTSLILHKLLPTASLEISPHGLEGIIVLYQATSCPSLSF